MKVFTSEFEHKLKAAVDRHIDATQEATVASAELQELVVLLSHTLNDMTGRVVSLQWPSDVDVKLP